MPWCEVKSQICMDRSIFCHYVILLADANALYLYYFITLLLLPGM